MKRHYSQLPVFEPQGEEIIKPFVKIFKNTNYSHSKLSPALPCSKNNPNEWIPQPRRAKSQQIESSTRILFCGGRLASLKRSVSQDRIGIHDVIRVKTVQLLLLQKDIQNLVEGLKRLNYFCRRYEDSQKLLIGILQSQVVSTAKSCKELISEFIDERRSCYNSQDKLDALRRSILLQKKDFIFCNESLQQSRNKLELLKQNIERKKIDYSIKQQIVEVNERRLMQKLRTRKSSPFRERTNTASGSIKFHTINEPATEDIKSSSSCAAVKVRAGSHHMCSVCSSRSSKDVYSLTNFDSKNLLNTKIFNNIT